MNGEKTSSKRGCWERREAEGKRPCRRRRGMRYVRISLVGAFSTNSAESLMMDVERTLGYALRQQGSASKPSVTLRPPT